MKKLLISIVAFVLLFGFMINVKAADNLKIEDVVTNLKDEIKKLQDGNSRPEITVTDITYANNKMTIKSDNYTMIYNYDSNTNTISFDNTIDSNSDYILESDAIVNRTLYVIGDLYGYDDNYINDLILNLYNSDYTFSDNNMEIVYANGEIPNLGAAPYIKSFKIGLSGGIGDKYVKTTTTTTPNDDSSVTTTQEEEQNPSTTKENYGLVILIEIVCIALISFGAYKIRKLKNN